MWEPSAFSIALIGTDGKIMAVQNNEGVEPECRFRASLILEKTGVLPKGKYMIVVLPLWHANPKFWEKDF